MPNLQSENFNFLNANVEIFGAELILNFIACSIMAFILRTFYLKFSFSINGKQNIGSILPILSLTVFLVIVIIKSSLALSLGLVGALSIVRFRTPIKEPEELVYLFLAIAIGLGFGAGRIITTTVITSLILIVVYFWLSNKVKNSLNEYNLIITWNKRDLKIEDIINELKFYSDSIDLVRTDSKKNESQAVFLIHPKDASFFGKLRSNLEKLDENININFFKSEINF
jgi:hypothetical protein